MASAAARAAAADFADIRELGRGVFGVVYLVRRASDGKEFAMKRVLLDGFSAEKRAAAVAELGLLRDLHHPGCVQYVTSSVDPAELCIVTEYCAGGDLAQWVRRLPERRFPPAALLPLAVSLLHALEYLHLKRVIHRDIKPANILMTAAGVPKLADFGVSRVAETEASLRGRTFAGSPAFMAPEVFLIRCEAEDEAALAAGYTETADVWSLGATLFTLLNNGRPLFTLEGAIKRVARDPAAWRMPALPEGTPPAAVALVAAMLVADPGARPSAAALLRSPLLEGVEPLSSALLVAMGGGRAATLTNDEAEGLAAVAAPAPAAHICSPRYNHRPAPQGAVWAAADAGDVRSLQAALSAGGSTEEADSDGASALAQASRKGHLEAVHTLLSAGAKVDSKDKYGWTPLHWAAQVGHTAVAQVLLGAGADKEAKMKLGGAPLHVAAVWGHTAVAQVLLEAGANKDAKAEDGETPLHVAAEEDHTAVAQVLLGAGADKEAKDKYGSTPLHVAALKGHTAVAQVLLEAGADKEAKEKTGKTPADLACQFGKADVLALLQTRR